MPPPIVSSTARGPMPDRRARILCNIEVVPRLQSSASALVSRSPTSRAGALPGRWSRSSCVPCVLMIARTSRHCRSAGFMVRQVAGTGRLRRRRSPSRSPGYRYRVPTHDVILSKREGLSRDRACSIRTGPNSTTAPAHTLRYHRLP